MEIVSNVILNLQTPAYSTVYAPQGDTLTRKIRARLMDGSTPWTVPSGATMVIRYRKPDGTFGFYDTDELGNAAYTVSGEYVTFTLAAQTMTVAGTVYMQLDFYAATNQHLSTFTLELDVSAAVVADGEIASENYINALTRSAAQLAQMMSIYYGAPRTAATSAAMTDHNLVYVYTGTTGGGFTEGHWYFWNGTAWTDGGVYNSTAFTTDPTLSIAGAAADAAACGDLKSALIRGYDATFDFFGGVVVDAQLGSAYWGESDSGSKTVIFSVNAGDVIDISTNITRAGYIAFLKSVDWFNLVGNAPDYSSATGYTSRITATANRDLQYTIPSEANDIKYFAFNYYMNGNDAFPRDIKINNVTVNINAVETLQDINAQIASEKITKNISAWTTGKRIANYKMVDTDGFSVTSIEAKKGDVITVTATTESSSVGVTAISIKLEDSSIYIPLSPNGAVAGTYIVPMDCTLYLSKTNSGAYGMAFTWVRYVGATENETVVKYTGFDYSLDTIRSTMTTMLANPQAIPDYPSKYAQKPLVLIHYSDVHLDVTRAYMASLFAVTYPEIDDVLFTGDCAGSYYDDYTGYYDYDILNKTLLAIGNHDVYANSSGTSFVTAAQKYTAYMNHVANWNVSQPQDAETNGLCYYYKDYDLTDGSYSDACTCTTVRLIVLDAMAYDLAEHTWLQSVLADAASNNIPCLIAEHFPPTFSTSDTAGFNTGFMSLSRGMEQAYGRAYLSYDNTAEHSAPALVDDFITNGGEFICWLCGHLHYGAVGTLISHPNQLYIAIELAKCTASVWSDTPRDLKNESQNLFNVISIDTYNKVIKVLRIGAQYDNRLRPKKSMSIDYANKTLLATE